MIQFSAHFDGKHLLPDEPVSLPENVPLQVTVDEGAAAPVVGNGPFDLLDRLEAEVGLVDGPSDWAAEHDHYLSGAPKRTDE